jgi:hypothetical protein
MSSVVSTPLRRNGGQALIGRFDVHSKLAIHKLFAIAEEGDGKYGLTLTSLTVQQDLEAGKDADDIEYIDQLDIDNDGQDEVITKSWGYESWGYTIWKKYRNPQWSIAFRGGGVGC